MYISKINKFYSSIFPDMMMLWELLSPLPPSVKEIESEPSTSDAGHKRVPHYPLQCSLKRRKETTPPTGQTSKGRAEIEMWRERKKKSEGENYRNVLPLFPSYTFAVRREGPGNRVTCTTAAHSALAWPPGFRWRTFLAQAREREKEERETEERDAKVSVSLYAPPLHLALLSSPSTEEKILSLSLFQIRGIIFNSALR